MVGLIALLVAAPALAADCPTGMFMAAAGPDTVSALEINKNGSFRYMLSEGAVDESAQGRWACDGGKLLLTTTPPPKAPQFMLGKVVENVGDVRRVQLPGGEKEWEVIDISYPA